MTKKMTQSLRDQQISEPEIIDLISSYRKMVKAGILKEKGFVKLLIKLGIDRPSDNQFILDENKVYTLKKKTVSWCNGLAPIVTDDKVWVRILRRLRHPMCVPELGRDILIPPIRNYFKKNVVGIKISCIFVKQTN